MSKETIQRLFSIRVGLIPRVHTDTRWLKYWEGTRRPSCSLKSSPCSWSTWRTVCKLRRRMQSMSRWLSSSLCYSNSFFKSLIQDWARQTLSMPTRIYRRILYWSTLKSQFSTPSIIWVKISLHHLTRFFVCTFWRSNTKFLRTLLLSKFSSPKKKRLSPKKSSMPKSTRRRGEETSWRVPDRPNLELNSRSQDQMAQGWCWTTFIKRPSIWITWARSTDKSRMHFMERITSRTKLRVRGTL